MEVVVGPGRHTVQLRVPEVLDLRSATSASSQVDVISDLQGVVGNFAAVCGIPLLSSLFQVVVRLLMCRLEA